MSDHFPHAKRIDAFTLIELLTVIAIIAVLMGLLFPALSGVRDTARKAQAKNDALGIVNAVKAYYTEYGKYPVASASDDFTTSNKDLVKVLVAKETGTTKLNPRMIVFMEIPPVKERSGAEVKKSGMSKDFEFYDPWGTPYKAAIDTNYDNELEVKDYNVTLNSGVAVWSYAKDVKKSAIAEDVVSWQ